MDTIKNIAHDLTIGAAGVTTLNIMPDEMNPNNVGTIIVTLFTCVLQLIKFLDGRKTRKNAKNKGNDLTN